MARDRIEDRRGELQSAFEKRMNEFMNPHAFPHVRWQDVTDARQAVIDHVHELAKRDQFEAPQESEGL